MTEITAAMSAQGEAELNRLTERRSTRKSDPDEREELWRESVRRYNARLQEEMRAELCSSHRDQAACLRAFWRA